MEECVAAKPTRLEIIIHADQIARRPEMHHPMHLIDEWSGLACGRAAIAIVTHALADTPVPGAEADLAAGAFLGLAIRVLALPPVAEGCREGSNRRDWGVHTLPRSVQNRPRTVVLFERVALAASLRVPALGVQPPAALSAV